MDPESEVRRSGQRTPPRGREFCRACLLPPVRCYCAELRPFDPGITVVVLIHPAEVRKSLATGRMTHRILEGSHLIDGVDFSEDPRVTALLEDPTGFPVVLAPGPEATDLTPLPREDRLAVFPEGRRPLVFVIDGTWPTANKMLRLSRRIGKLPRICFTPPRPSRFIVRRQPRETCFSTIEAVHHLLTLMDPEGDPPGAANLLHCLDWMVNRELEFRSGQRRGRLPPYRPTNRPEVG